MQPIFIISLPRSGSTLLQRVIGSSNLVHTASEPWLIPALLSTYCDSEQYSRHGNKLTNIGVHDFISTLPNETRDYRDCMRCFLLDLYRRSSPKGTQYFIDKTPRNTLFLSELHEIFPDAKFVYLWRNPASIVSSILESFSDGNWRLYSNYVDLYDGYDELYDSHLAHTDKIINISYEDLVSKPIITINRLSEYLSIDLTNSHTNFTDVNLTGALGDKEGIDIYSSLSDQSIDKWKQTFCNIYRKRWLKNYLKWIGEERLVCTGYDYERILSEIDGIPNGTNKLIRDISRSTYGWFRRMLVLDAAINSFVGDRKSSPRILVN